MNNTIDQFWYVYILLMSNGKYYTGYTQNIIERLERHQNGMVPYTKPYRPVELIFYSAFKDKYLALSFEKYLKSGSGRAFMAKHLV
ncbi:MAG: GIY-YIG nuclease family protein [Bacteroidales bacterium]